MQELVRPGIGGRGVRRGEPGIEDCRDRRCEIGEGVFRRLGHVQAECLCIHDLELLSLLHPADRHLIGRKAADAQRAVVRPLHVLGRDRRAVVEHCIGLELENDRHPVGRDFPTFRKLAVQLGRIVAHGAVGIDLGVEADKAIIGVDADLVAGAAQAGAQNVEGGDGVADRHDDRVGLGGGGHGLQQRGQARAKPERPRANEKLASIHPRSPKKRLRRNDGTGRRGTRN